MGEETKKFKLREEKHVMREVEFMAWSPTMDLLAFANSDAEVLVNRLSWQRVWSLAPPNEGDKVGGLAWRPDGKVIAVGYKSGTVRICDVEKGDLVHIATVENAVSSLNWLEHSKTPCLEDDEETYEEDNSADYLPSAREQAPVYVDDTLTKDQSNNLEAYESFRTLASQKGLNLLLVGTVKNRVHILCYGAFPTGIVDLETDGDTQNSSVKSAIISSDLSSLSVMLQSNVDGNINMWVKTYDTSLLLSRCSEIRLLASKYVMIASALMELHVILQQMCEAWEDILREMDSKLLKFAEEKKRLNPKASVSNDFLELLLFGTTSLELQSFLLHDLTDKGLKKLDFSIDNSYRNIQKLVVRQLQRVSQNITSHLSDLYGMSQWYDKYGILGLNTNNVQNAVKTAGAFALCGCELQQVIETSIKNFKAFFRWLYIAILRLSNIPPPAEMNKMTQHDIQFVADFLRDNFTHLLEEDENEKDLSPDMDQMSMHITPLQMPTSSSKKESPSISSKIGGGDGSSERIKKLSQGFKLEKVGQYLRRESLVQPPNYHDNPWTQFLNSSSLQNSSKVLYPSLHGKSLVQRKEMLDTAIASAVFEPSNVIGTSMLCKTTFQLFSCKECKEDSAIQPKVCQFTDEDTGQMWVAYVSSYFPCKSIYLMKQPASDPNHLEVVHITVGKIGDPFSDDSATWPNKYVCESHQFLDFAVYNSQNLTLLLKEEGEDELTLLLQLPLAVIPVDNYTRVTPDTFSLQREMQTVDVGPLLSHASVSYQTEVAGHSIAVGGIRTTAAMLLRSRRRIRLFLLEEGEADEDEDEEEEENESFPPEVTTGDSSNLEVDVTGDAEDKENKSLD